MWVAFGANCLACNDNPRRLDQENIIGSGLLGRSVEVMSRVGLQKLGKLPCIQGVQLRNHAARHLISTIQAIQDRGHMSHYMQVRSKCRGVVLATLSLCVWATAQADVSPMADEELADVWGQAMFTVENKSGVNGFDLTRITLNADVKLNANFYNITAGGDATNGPGIDIGNFNFVSSKVNGADVSYVQFVDPYIELVYKDQSSATDRQVIGARIGFGEITGEMGIQINKRRGNLRVLDGGGTGEGLIKTDDIPDPTSTLSGSQSTFSCQNAGVGQCGADGRIAANRVSAVSADKSKDFFISFLANQVNFGDGTSAPAGISMNWTSNLTYKSLSGVPLENKLPSLGARRQGG